ncbi:MAG TPA: hypothetical protein PKY59_06675 [Pyrinomonadaceae bacterium]|nr:hypothetical protein [Pyrinomonadaceae bacterium]
MLNRLFFIAFFVSIFCFNSFSQTDFQNNTPDNATEIQRLSPDFSALSNLFLPEEQGAWTITITRGGGIFREAPKFIGLLNSNGQFICNNKIKTLEAEPLKEISELMSKSDFKTIKKAFKTNAAFCNDCYVTQFTIKYQIKKKKTLTFDFAWLAVPESTPELLKIFEKTKNHAVCEE